MSNSVGCWIGAVVVLFVTVECKCRGEEAVLFNFGDSNSDTGGLSAGLGYNFPLPYGRTFFGRPTGRICDGRLLIDFLCESLNTSYLSPYMEGLRSSFENGANFAVAGSMTQPRDTPFALHIQVQQFLHFRSRSLELASRGFKGLIREHGFQNALYILDIGQNDLSAAFTSNISVSKAMEKIPSIISEIEIFIKTIRNYGGKNFWVHNTGPLGCLPQKLALPRKDDSDLDAYGCLKTLNTFAREFNLRLSTLCDRLNSESSNGTVVYTDIYSLKYDLISNHKKYGFDSPLMACCGHGGPPYNFDMNRICGMVGFQVCPEGARYISWDGVHYTEDANKIVASRILSGAYSKPQVKFDFFCNN